MRPAAGGGGGGEEDTSHETCATSPEIGALRMGHGSWPPVRARGTIPEEGDEGAEG